MKDLTKQRMSKQGKAAVGQNRKFYSPWEKGKVDATVDSIEEFDLGKRGKRKVAYGKDSQGRTLRQFTS